MKITRVQATSQSSPRTDPIRDALQALDNNGSCRVEIETSEGVTGHSVTGFGRVAAAPALLARLIEDELAPAVVGRDPFMVRQIRDDLWRLTEYHGTEGLALFGISAIDVAIWDVIGKALKVPVWRALGGARERVPAYAMVGWLNYDLDRLKRICSRAVEQGFAGVKMKVGAPTLEEDVERIEAVRAAVGRGVHVMVDANQVFSVAEALRRGLVYQELGCFWFEEPIRADDVDGLAHLAEELVIPVASGENNYGKRQFGRLFERHAVDIVQPDLRRAGGITECFEIGLAAAAFDLPYASHGGGAHIHVLAALPNTFFMESGLLPEGSPIRLVDGSFPLPQEPGVG
ncbi:MAG TPA: mandelate racemase/muconate lactonizing enzyme family protein [Candidatus Dormibacteraeota bacterium]|nr:mandelate racemase/muconate lactonizing enzyme family protein [Candidatus Dormibacteraeota bacterium]